MNVKGRSARAIGFAIGFCSICGPAFSQTAPALPSSQSGPTPPDRQVFYSNIEPTIARELGDPRPTSANEALRALDWLIYGHLIVGGAYDSNTVASPTQQPAYGTRFQPYVIAERNNGIQRTLVYGTGDIRYYPSLGETQVVNTTAGISHIWEIQRDLIFRAQAEATRGMDTSGLTGLSTAPGVSYTNPVKYTSLFASSSIQKSFGNFFTAIGASVTGTTYDDTTDNLGNVVSEQYRNGTLSTLNARVGYHLTPLVYTFVEPSLISASYNASSLNSDGYKIKAGLGTDRISLFSGEIYAGTLSQHFTDPTIAPLTSPMYGGKLSWYPTRFVTVTGAVDQSIGTSDFTVGLYTPGSVTKINTSKLTTSWSPSRTVDLTGRLVLMQYEFLNSFRRDDSTEIGVAVAYKVSTRFSIVVDLSHVEYTSNLAGAGYTRNFVSVGGNSKF
jgi:hypothetical protein